MKSDYYSEKSVGYGFGHTRLNRIKQLIGDEKNLRILDVGCAGGRLGGEIRKMGHYVAGADISPAAAQVAKSHLDEVFVFDIEKPWPQEISNGSFDLVLLPEILEHVFDPVAVLQSASRVLKPKGEIIITTPNFMTWTNRLRFLFGNFKYQEQGMFDFGHIRWFTYPYLQEVLKKASFNIIAQNHISFPNKLSFVLKYWPGLFTWQFVVKAQKQ